MEADTARLESSVAGAESRIFNLEREVQTLQGYFAGKTPTKIESPTGLEGFNHSYEVMAQPLGVVPAEEFGHPLRVVSAGTVQAPKYTISNGSITDGTNGVAFGLSSIVTEDEDAPVEHSASAGFVCIIATIDPETLVPSGWSIEVVDEADAKEVEFNSDGKQIKARLVLAKLTLEGTSVTVDQMWNTSAMLGHAFHNGAIVKVFSAASTHPSKV